MMVLSNQAIERVKMRTFHRGNAPFCGTSTNAFVGMGAGTLLYFKLLVRSPMSAKAQETVLTVCCPVQKLLMATFLAMSIIALPALLFNSVGSRITEDKLDTLSFAVTTLGNIGGCVGDVNSTFMGTADALNCTSSTAPITVLGHDFEADTVAYIVTACDGAYSFVFLLSVLLISSVINSTEEEFEHKRVSINRCAAAV